MKATLCAIFVLTSCLVLSAESKVPCAAQYILDACVKMEQTTLNKCAYSDWGCKCLAQKSILSCYNNCPLDDNRSGEQGQVEVYCNAANAASSSSADVVSSINSIVSTATRSSARDGDVNSTPGVMDSHGIKNGAKVPGGERKDRNDGAGKKRKSHRPSVSGFPKSEFGTNGASRDTQAAAVALFVALAGSAMMV